MVAQTKVQDILVLGFGAVGAIYSLILKRSERACVTVVARSNYESLRTRGVHIRSKKYGNHQGWKPDRVFQSVQRALDRPYSYVLVCTKCVPELSKTSTILSPFLSRETYPHPQPTYVLMQNGLNVEKDLYQSLKDAGERDPQIISTAVWIGTNMKEEGGQSVVTHNDFDRVSVGMYSPTYTSTPATEALTTFASLLETGGSTIAVTPDVHAVKFAKNFWNLAFATFATLTRYRLPAIFRHPTQDQDMPEPYVAPITAELINQYTIPSIRATLKEVLSVGRAFGFGETVLPESVVDTTIQNTGRLHATPESIHTPSMLLDVQMGRPMEVEVIVGEVVRMAHEKGVDIPRIETLYSLLLVVQNQLLGKTEPRL